MARRKIIKSVRRVKDSAFACYDMARPDIVYIRKTYGPWVGGETDIAHDECFCIIDRVPCPPSALQVGGSYRVLLRGQVCYIPVHQVRAHTVEIDGTDHRNNA